MTVRFVSYSGRTWPAKELKALTKPPALNFLRRRRSSRLGERGPTRMNNRNSYPPRRRDLARATYLERHRVTVTGRWLNVGKAIMLPNVHQRLNSVHDLWEIIGQLALRRAKVFACSHGQPPIDQRFVERQEITCMAD